MSLKYAKLNILLRKFFRTKKEKYKNPAIFVFLYPMRMIYPYFIIFIIFSFASNQVQAQKDVLISRKNDEGLYGYVNQYGKKRIDYQYVYAGEFFNGYAVVMQQDSFYYINQEGELASGGYDLAYPFIDDYTIIGRGDKFAYIDTGFNVIQNRWFKEAYLFQRGYAVGKIAKKKFLLSEKGRMSRVTNSYNIPVQGEIHEVVEKMPYYPGGDKNLQNYIREHISAEIHIPLAYVSFQVEKDGSLKKISVMGNAPAETKNQIRQLFMEMPPWIPGRQGGEKIRVKMNIPISVKHNK